MITEPVMAIVLTVGVPGGVADPTVVGVIAIGLTIALVAAARGLGQDRGRRPRPPRSTGRPSPTRPASRRPSRPRARPPIVPFSYWYALVPFEDTTQIKERPVLVLWQDGSNARVLKVTSQDKRGRDNFHPVDTSGWDRPGKRGGSWVQTDAVVTVPLEGFRRCLGRELDATFTQQLTRKHGNHLF